MCLFQCEVLQQKLDNLLKTLREESLRAEAHEESGIEPEESSSDSVPEMAPRTEGVSFVKFFVLDRNCICRN